MAWNNVYFTDGKLADDSLFDRFADGETAINNLDEQSTQRAAFNEDHAATVVGGLYGASSLFISADTGDHKYSRAVFTGASMTYPGWDNDSVNETGIATQPAWVVIGHASATSVEGYSSGLAKIAFTTGDGVPLEADGAIQGVLVLFNCEIIDASDDSDLEIAFCIQARIGTSWRTLAHTERAVRLENHKVDLSSTTELVLLDVPIATLISYDVYQAEPVSVGSGLRGVRACVSLRGGTGTSWVTLGRWNLSAIPLRCEAP